MARLCDRQDSGVGEHEHGLDPELPPPPPHHLLQRPGGQPGAGADQDDGLPQGLLHQGADGVCSGQERGNLQAEEEEWWPEKAGLQQLSNFCGEQEEKQGSSVCQRIQYQMKIKCNRKK